MIHAGVPRWARAAMVGCAVVIPVHAAQAQVGDTSGITYPGWIPSDRVLPVITVEVRYDSATSLWRYDYTLADAAGAEQGIETLILRSTASSRS